VFCILVTLPQSLFLVGYFPSPHSHLKYCRCPCLASNSVKDFDHLPVKNLLQHALNERHSSQRRSAPAGTNATATLAPLLEDRTSVTDTQTSAVTEHTAGRAHFRAKGNVVVEHTTKAYSIRGGNVPSLLILDTRWRLMVSLTFRTLYPSTKNTAGNSNVGRWVCSKESRDVLVNLNGFLFQAIDPGLSSS